MRSTHNSEYIAYREMPDNGAHCRSPNVRHILFKIVYGETCVVGISDAEEQGTGNRHRNIVACKASKVFDINLMMQITIRFEYSKAQNSPLTEVSRMFTCCTVW